MHRKRAGGQVNLYNVAGLQGSNRSASGSFWGNVSNAGAARAARKAPVGDEGHLLAQAHAHDGAGGAEHFLHTGAAARTFVADDDHFARLNLTGQNAAHCGFLRIVDAGRTAEDLHRSSHAGRLDDCAVGGQIAKQNCQSAVLGICFRSGVDHSRVFDGSGFHHLT
ncbi:hypothetical protein SDC9_141382 [bioreactor metagenome]|uniref:Uncharacterized protein n=1 Tax=bioreactor metagenome TaxID=1076179 RepID=A0A645DXY0_9ZZZZ